jgi:hypothetical protein
MTFSIMSFGIMTFIIMKFGIMTFGIITFSIMTFIIMTVSINTVSFEGLNTKFSIMFDDCGIFIVTLTVFTLSVVMPSVVAPIDDVKSVAPRCFFKPQNSPIS